MPNMESAVVVVESIGVTKDGDQIDENHGLICRMRSIVGDRCCSFIETVS